MPINKFAAARYKLIHQLLCKYDFVKTSTIVDYCQQLLGFVVTKRTIQLDLQAMKEDDFVGIFAPIAYCTSRKAYYYEHKDFVSKQLFFTTYEIELVMAIAERWRCELSEVEQKQLTVIVGKMQLMDMAK